MSNSIIGQPAPDFSLPAVSADNLAPRVVSRDDYRGRWLALIFYPHDFSFVCPTELTAFSARLDDFAARDCDLLGISVDTIELHQEWLSKPVQDGGLGPLRFPLASDHDTKASCSYGVWIPDKQVATRGLFIIDPEGVLQYSVMHNLSVGRGTDTVLRVLDALRTGGLCSANWTTADGVIDPERALAPGKILGHYRIAKKIGSGAFGAVFAAQDLLLERTVALKVLKRGLVESREAVLREARAVARLNHPNVCTIYAVEEHDGLPIIAMEYLEGRPLSRWIADGMNDEDVQSIATQIAAGLAAAHALDIVHGDLKPANVIVSEDRIAKTLDFGLSRSNQLDSDAKRLASLNSLARFGEALRTANPAADATVDFTESMTSGAAGIRGTMAYLAPEQAKGDAATPASDVFSFGVTLVEMLSGAPAYSETNAAKLLYRLQTEDTAPELAARVPEAYRGFVANLLARNPAQRLGMQEAADWLGAMTAARI